MVVGWCAVKRVQDVTKVDDHNMGDEVRKFAFQTLSQILECRTLNHKFVSVTALLYHECWKGLPPSVFIGEMVATVNCLKNPFPSPLSGILN